MSGQSFPLVSAAWLAAHLADPDLVLFDASAYMSAEGKDGHAEYLKVHIPGARFFDVDEVADPGTDLPHMAPSQERFTRLVRALGANNGSRVVFYDQKGLFSAARGWWLFRLFGHERVAVLDGGLPKWQAEGRAVEAGEPAPAAEGDFRPVFRAVLLRGLGDVRDNLESRRELVLDARAAPRFVGAVEEPRPGLRRGHIPHSRNLPFPQLLQADQTLKPTAELREIFLALGVEPETAVVASCGSGLTACILSLGLAAAGYGPAAVYDGSWAEWGTRDDADAPVTVGGEP